MTSQHLDAADIYFMFATYDFAAAKLAAIARTVSDCTDTNMFIIVSMDADHATGIDFPVLLHVHFPIIPINLNKIVSVCQASYPDDYDGVSISKRTSSRSHSLSSLLKKVMKKH